MLFVSIGEEFSLNITEKFFLFLFVLFLTPLLLISGDEKDPIKSLINAWNKQLNIDSAIELESNEEFFTSEVRLQLTEALKTFIGKSNAREIVNNLYLKQIDPKKFNTEYLDIKLKKGENIGGVSLVELRKKRVFRKNKCHIYFFYTVKKEPSGYFGLMVNVYSYYIFIYWDKNKKILTSFAERTFYEKLDVKMISDIQVNVFNECQEDVKRIKRDFQNQLLEKEKFFRQQLEDMQASHDLEVQQLENKVIKNNNNNFYRFQGLVFFAFLYYLINCCF